MQNLEPADFPRPVIYCEWLLQQCRERLNFLNCILFSHEAEFTRNAVFNSHNTHIWSYENPHARQEVLFQRQFSINGSAGIVNHRLVGSYVLPNRLNATQYLDVEVSLGERVRMWYLHDGTLPDFVKPVSEWLNNHFPNQWVGRNGPVAWPSRSPGLWGCMKLLVYGNQQYPETIVEFQQRVEVAFARVRGTPGVFYVSLQIIMLRRAEA